MRGTARLLDVKYSPVIRRIATRCVGAAGAAFCHEDYGGMVVRLEAGESRGWDFRDDLQATGVF